MSTSYLPLRNSLPPQVFQGFNAGMTVKRILDLPQFEQTADAITKAGKRLILKSKEQVEEIARANPSFANTMQAIDRLDAYESTESHRIHLLQNVSPSDEVRKAAQDVSIEFQDWAVEKAYHPGLYKAVKAFAATDPKLEGEDKKLLEETLTDYKRIGLDLPQDKQNELKDLQKQLSQIETDFSQAINDYEDELWVKESELSGCDPEFIKNLKVNEKGERRVTLQYPDYLPVMEFCRSEDVRKQLTIKKYKTAQTVNVERLNKMIELRDKIAALLGYKSYNHYVIEERMAKSPERVLTFLNQFEERLKVKGDKELEELRRLKAEVTGQETPHFFAWDYLFYSTLYKKKYFNVDLMELKDFFPLENVLQGMLSVMADVFGLKFVEQKKGSFPTWHEDVRLFVVNDESGALVGAFYMDLFPRPGKYGHAAAFGLVEGYLRDDGSYQAPVEAMVCNFPSNSPSLLSHSEVETFFHEFGHILHGVVTRAKYVKFSGTSVAWDFVEAPSQVLENWCWDADILNRIARHVKDPSKKISKDFVEKMSKAHKAGMGMFYRRQLSFAKADLEFHTSGEVKNSTDIMNRVLSETFLPPPSDTAFQAGWGHMVGYASGYYGYAWADVMAADMFSLFKKNGLLDPATGRRLRAEIYEPGSGRDELESLEKFLGRSLSDEAFFEQLGV